MLRVRDIYDWIDAYAPFRYAQSWDHCGLQVGDPEAPVNRLLVGLDPGSKTINEAEGRGCQCLVTHHPLIFKPLDEVRVDKFPGNLVLRALVAGVHVIAAHTNLDVAKSGTNDQLSNLLSLSDAEPLEIDGKWKPEESYGGMGRIGFLPKEMRLADMLLICERELSVQGARIVGNPERPVKKVALCAGSGGSLLDLAISARVDVYITGDIKYHEAQRALEEGLALIDIGHFGSERIIVKPLVDYFRSQAERENIALEIFPAEGERDPFFVSVRS